MAVRLYEPDKTPLREFVSRGYAAYNLPFTPPINTYASSPNENSSPHHAELLPLLSFLPVFVTDTFQQKNLPVSAYVRSAIPFQYPPATHRQHHLLLLPNHVIRQTAPDSYIAVDTPSVCN